MLSASVVCVCLPRRIATSPCLATLKGLLPAWGLSLRAGSSQGAGAMWPDAATLRTLRGWTLSSDPILQRCGLGALAKLVQSGEGVWALLLLA